MTNETLKQSGGNDKVTAANLRKFEELEKKYVKAKQQVISNDRNIGDALNLFQQFKMKQSQLDQLTNILMRE